MGKLHKIIGCGIVILPLSFLLYSIYTTHGRNAGLPATLLIPPCLLLIYRLFWAVERMVLTPQYYRYKPRVSNMFGGTLQEKSLVLEGETGKNVEWLRQRLSNLSDTEKENTGK